MFHTDSNSYEKLHHFKTGSTLKCRNALASEITLLNCTYTETLKFHLYNKTRHLYIYMSPIAGQTAGPIGLNFFGDTQGFQGGVLG